MAPKRKYLEEIDPNRQITAFFRARIKSPEEEGVEIAATETSPPAQPILSLVPPLVAPVTATPLPVEEQLLVMQATPDALAAFYNMLHHSDKAPQSRNQSLPPFVRSTTDADLLFPQDLPHGHCHALFTRTRRGSEVSVSLKLTEGGSNNDSPRTNLLQGLPGRKIYIYHVLAAHLARTAPSPRLNLALLETVSQSKPQSQAPLTILHLCGQKWCMNPDHYAVGTKRLNDEQTSCHRGLQSARNREAYDLMERAYCQHTPEAGQ